MVAFAESFVGKSPYVWGGASPCGFDCSGFTMYVYSNFGVGLPHNAAAQQSCATPVPSGQAQPGDLVFFGTPAYHVGIYVGGGSMVNAPHTGAYVSYGSVAGAAGFGRPLAFRPWPLPPRGARTRQALPHPRHSLVLPTKVNICGRAPMMKGNPESADGDELT